MAGDSKKAVYAATVPEVAAALNQAETAVRDAVPAVDLIYVEPDVYLPDETEAS